MVVKELRGPGGSLVFVQVMSSKGHVIPVTPEDYEELKSSFSARPKANPSFDQASWQEGFVAGLKFAREDAQVVQGQG
jgi:hypothetical protein